MKRLPYPLKHLFLYTFVLIVSISSVLPAQAVSAESCPPGTRCVFLPLLAQAPPAPTGDLTITSIEVTQGVQDSANSVPLVAGRSTVVRIYAQGLGGLSAATGVNVAVSAGQTASVLSGSPMLLTADVKAAPSQSDYRSTINVTLPTAWLQGSYALSVTLDPNNTVPEVNEGNNSRVQAVSFVAMPALKVKIIPIAYTHTPDGRSFPAPTQDCVGDMIKRLYPVSQVEVSWHAPYAFSGNLKDVAGFSKLLSELNALKSGENAPEEVVYFGLVPTKGLAGSWFNGGVVGIGYVGRRVSLGLDYNNSGVTAAHEIGHNLGRYHAPCGSVSNPDPTFPYANAAIGVFGLDVASGVTYSPDGGRDLMSYCTPKWISDYTYKALWQALVRAPGATSLSVEGGSPQPALLVRAMLDTNGVSFLPAYPLGAQPFIPPAESSYAIQLIAADGQVAAETPAEGFELSSDDGRVEVQARVPLPDVPVSALRLLKDGQVLAETALRAAGPVTALAAADHPVAVETVGSGQRVTWTPADAPAMLRFSIDGGQTWTVLGVDLSGGELQLASEIIPPGAMIEVVRAVSQ